MQVVYLDTLFALNALMDYLLLLASARMAGEPLYRGRLVLAAVFGGVYASGAVLVGGPLIHPVFKLGTAVLMVLIGLGRSRRLLRQTLIFFFLSCALGGGVLAIGTMGGTGAAQGGVIRSGMDLKVVLLSASVCYFFVSVVTKRAARHSGKHGELMEVSLELCDKRISFTALMDTGNTLTDPVNGQGVLVVDWDIVKPLLPEIQPRHISEPTYGMEQLSNCMPAGRCRLVPFRAVGVECGMLLAIRADRAMIGGREVVRPLVALSPTAVSDGGGYHALVGDGV